MGALVAKLVRTTSPSSLVLVFAMSLVVVCCFGASESDFLLKFKEELTNSTSLTNWNPSTGPCDWNRGNWIGVLCLNGSVWGLQLENMGLTGVIDVETLSSLPNFRTISLMNNNFEGTWPGLGKIETLRSVYLSNNKFSGEIPDDAFQRMESLKRVLLSNNHFTGPIPSSLAELPNLVELRLDGNLFEGQIPGFKENSMRSLNLANNNLEGAIPTSLSKMDATSFKGNKNLCGPPLRSCDVPNASKSAKLLKVAITLMVVGIILAVIAATCIIIQCKRQNTIQLGRATSNDSNMIASSFREEPHKLPVKGGHYMWRPDQGKLSFVRDDIERFDLQDLLRASAEILGSGTFGSSYKAVIMSGQALVVKRYKQMKNVGREEFHEHMRRLGRLRHPNLQPLAAYYYRKEEKLLISEFVENGSLASLLHGNHTVDNPGLDWQTRLKIVKGVARGLDYLYKELPIVVPHGHIKSSNVLIDEFYEPLLTDYALRPVINPEHAHATMIAYKSPEYAREGHTSGKTDIWSLGILILEILTGKYPENYLSQGYESNADLATWVNTMVKEKRTSEVFDKDMIGTKNSKGEMINLLKIGLCCCEEDVGRRLGIRQVMEKINELKDGSDADEDLTSNASEGYAWSSRGTDDDFSYSNR
ncbi:inactive leucine-rich repeat receptor-like protein kinase [Tripterygium wilfordii]|uniref:non-specific serine/threonine protein kinase n=2 Tax=Tripterygium wilfordii TaxID=458696 RepID=A0A7J7CYQ0_TRIWF|nr:inactive leucine-rich repeat receptor-like protein kinase [Tripterygium wilfordii]